MKIVTYNGKTFTYEDCSSPKDLKIGEEYVVKYSISTDYQTNYKLYGVEGIFNSIWFDDVKSTHINWCIPSLEMREGYSILFFYILFIYKWWHTSKSHHLFFYWMLKCKFICPQSNLFSFSTNSIFLVTI